MKNILWISPYVPYDTVRHAGGKIENFYIKGLQKSGNFKIHLISCFESQERELLDLEKYGIQSNLCEIKGDYVSLFFKKLINAESTLNPFNRNAGYLQNYMEHLLKQGIRRFALNTNSFSPDIIVLQWTETVLLIDYVKKWFPNKKIVVIEEDVAFLGYKRKWEYEKNKIRKKIALYKYLKIKRDELAALGKSNLVIVNNLKDKKLLEENKMEDKKLFVWSPYFEDYRDLVRTNTSKNIIFYGAMNRPENYLSAIWFIEHVFDRINDPECKFLIIGSRPAEQLLKYQSERIKVLGFVPDVRDYFSTALCLVAPLVLGAGIKIKILEALSAGLPVLTNDIGIEGIPAEDQKDYFYCIKEEDYINKINSLLTNKTLGIQISDHAKRFIESNYNLERDLIRLMDVLNQL